jgi:hypothetical protein
MPTNTYLTPTRRALLEAVHEGRVLEGHEDDHTWLVEIGYEHRKVCARIKEAERAGWVELAAESMPFWRLTDAGREVLGWTGK